MTLSVRLFLLAGIAIPAIAAAQTQAGQSAMDQAQAAAQQMEDDRTPQVIKDTFGEKPKCNGGMTAAECAKYQNDAMQERANRFRDPGKGGKYGGAKQGGMTPEAQIAQEAAGNAEVVDLANRYSEALMKGDKAEADRLAAKMKTATARLEAARASGTNSGSSNQAQLGDLENRAAALLEEAQAAAMAEDRATYERASRELNEINASIDSLKRGSGAAQGTDTQVELAHQRELLEQFKAAASRNDEAETSRIYLEMQKFNNKMLGQQQGYVDAAVAALAADDHEGWESNGEKAGDVAKEMMRQRLRDFGIDDPDGFAREMQAAEEEQAPARTGAKPKIINVKRPPKKQDNYTGPLTAEDDDLIAPLDDGDNRSAPAADGKPRAHQQESGKQLSERRGLEGQMRDASAAYDRILAARESGKFTGDSSDEALEAAKTARDTAELKYEDYLIANAPDELKAWQESTGKVSRPGRWGDDARIVSNARDKAKAAYDDYVAAAEKQKANPTPEGRVLEQALADRYEAARQEYDQAAKQVAPAAAERETKARQNPRAPVELVPGMKSDLPEGSAGLPEYDGPKGTGPGGAAGQPDIRNGMTQEEAARYSDLVDAQERTKAAAAGLNANLNEETSRNYKEAVANQKKAEAAFKEAQTRKP